MKTRKHIEGLGEMTGKMTKGEIRRRRGSRGRKEEGMKCVSKCP